MSKLKEHLESFLQRVGSGSVEVYNEPSLQHELGIHLREHLAGERRVQFERNVTHFHGSRKGFVKREIDLSLIHPVSGDLREAIELKFPRNGQVPEQMFAFCKDIQFLEELVGAGATEGYLLILVEDPKFYSGRTVDGIYRFFRGERTVAVHGSITKPTGAKDKVLSIRGRHEVNWIRLPNEMRYALISVDKASNPTTP